jgi:solute carrier family 30 (zinc transporter), member 5/7
MQHSHSHQGPHHEHSHDHFDHSSYDNDKNKSVRINVPFTFGPATTHSQSSKNKSRGWLVTMRRYISAIVSDRKTRNVFFYLLLNLSFMMVEIIYGYITNSLGLIGLLYIDTQLIKAMVYI